MSSTVGGVERVAIVIDLPAAKRLAFGVVRGQAAVTAVAALVGFALASALAPTTLDDWGWRVAFLVGATVVPLGLMLRRTLPET